jgi:HAD superfamily hydrolase (TIGR01509 family)
MGSSAGAPDWRSRGVVTRRHPRAVVFDVDGTLVDSERDGHRVAFNRAFEEFGLPLRWDVDHYGELLTITGGQRRLQADFDRVGIPEPERAELVPRVHARKTEIFREMAAGGQFTARPGVERLLRELEDAGVRLGVATTGTRTWVAALLDRLFGPGRFEVVITGDEAPDRKPDPSAYHMAMERMGTAAGETVSVEDSHNGLVAAAAAGLPCVVVVNGYTRGQDLAGADLVLDGFGNPGEPAGVLHDPHDLRPPGHLDVDTLERLHAVRARGAQRG